MTIQNAADSTPEPQVDVAKIDEIVNSRVEQAIAAMQRQSLRQAPAVQAPRPARAQSAIQEFLANGGDKESLEHYLKLTEAIISDREAQAAVQTNQYLTDAFDKQCFKMTEDAIAELGAAIPAIKAGGAGLRKELAQKVSRLVGNNSKYADIAEEVSRKELPTLLRLKEAAAEVVDGYCKTAGIQKPTQQLDLQNSRPTMKDDASEDDVESMSKEAQQIYDLTLKYNKDPKVALARAKETNRKR